MDSKENQGGSPSSSLNTSRNRFWSNNIRILGLIITGIAIVLSLAGIEPWYAALQQTCDALQPSFSTTFCATYIISWEILFGAAFFVTAILLFWYRADTIMTVVLAGTMVTIGTIGPGMTDMLIRTNHNPFLLYSIWIARALASTCTLLLFYLLPNGKFTPKWTQLLAVIWIFLNIIWMFDLKLPANPINGEVWRSNFIASLSVDLLAYGSGLYAQIYRRTHASRDQRDLMNWIAFGMTFAFVGGVIYFFSHFLPQFYGFASSMYILLRTPLPVILFIGLLICLAIAARRHDLWQLGFIVNRTFVYTAIFVIIIAISSIAIGIITTMFPNNTTREFDFVIFGIVGMSFQSLRAYVQRIINRLMYGETEEPLTVIQSLSQVLGATLNLNQVLPSITQTIYRTMKFPYVAISLRQGDQFVIAESQGRNVGMFKSFPLIWQGEQIGELHISPRGQDERFTDLENNVIKELARQAGAAVQAVRITSQLDCAREQSVIQLEEERQRIQREIHDALTKLPAVMLKLDNIRKKHRSQLYNIDMELLEVRSHIKDVTTELRHLIYGLVSPHIPLGLLGAVRSHVGLLLDRMHSDEDQDPNNISITLDLPDTLPPMPAKIEVSAFRIVQTALDNVIKHAQARTCSVRIEATQDLHLTITDDGIGLPQEYLMGIGIASMAERAYALGGMFQVTTLPQRGTQIHVQIPLLHLKHSAGA